MFITKSLIPLKKRREEEEDVSCCCCREDPPPPLPLTTRDCWLPREGTIRSELPRDVKRTGDEDGGTVLDGGCDDAIAWLDTVVGVETVDEEAEEDVDDDEKEEDDKWIEEEAGEGIAAVAALLTLLKPVLDMPLLP